MTTSTEPTTHRPKSGSFWILATFALALVCVAAGTFTVLPFVVGHRSPARDTLGGPFRLQTSTGGILDSASLAGQPFLVFFGFTRCPNVCPTTLADLTNLIDGLREEGGDIRALFITVDPEHDTAEVLREYLTSFSDRITGLTGTPEAIAGVTRAYHAYVRRESLPEGGETIEHTLLVYLMDQQGRFVGPLDLAAGHKLAIQQIRRLMTGTSKQS